MGIPGVEGKLVTQSTIQVKGQETPDKLKQSSEPGVSDNFVSGESKRSLVQVPPRAPTLSGKIQENLNSLELRLNTAKFAYEETKATIKKVQGQQEKFQAALSRYESIGNKTTSSFARWFTRELNPGKLGLSKQDIKEWDAWMKAAPDKAAPDKKHRDWLKFKFQEAYDQLNPKTTLKTTPQTTPLINTSKKQFKEIAEITEKQSAVKALMIPAQSVEAGQKVVLSTPVEDSIIGRQQNLVKQSETIEQHLKKLREIRDNDPVNNLARLQAKKDELEYNGLRDKLATLANKYRKSNDPRWAQVEKELNKLLESFKDNTKVGEVVIQDGKADEYAKVLQEIEEENAKKEFFDVTQDVLKELNKTIAQLELQLAQINFAQMVIKAQEKVKNLDAASATFETEYKNLVKESSELNLYAQAEKRRNELYPESKLDPAKLYSRLLLTHVLELETGAQIAEGDAVFVPEKARLEALLEQKKKEYAAVLKEREQALKYTNDQRFLWDIGYYAVKDVSEIENIFKSYTDRVKEIISKGTNAEEMKGLINAAREICVTSLQKEIPNAIQKKTEFLYSSFKGMIRGFKNGVIGVDSSKVFSELLNKIQAMAISELSKETLSNYLLRSLDPELPAEIIKLIRQTVRELMPLPKAKQ